MRKAAKKLGKKGERKAARFLRKNGYKVVARNIRFGHNELDIVAKKSGVIVFVEVKTRSYQTAEEVAFSPPSLAVDGGKRRRTLEAAYAYLKKYPTDLLPRMDVIEVSFLRAKHLKLLRINQIENAFDANGKTR